MDKIGTLLCALAALLAGGCRGRHATGAQPSLRVEVIEAATDTVPNRMSFVSSVESNFDALIEPRVNGYLVNKYFSSGMPVRKGQLLFTIDPNLLSTTLLSAEASLESARAQEVSARNNYERAVPLARIDAISQTQLDQYTAEYVAAQAAVRSAEQQVRNARLQVGYTRIYAPIDGIIEQRPYGRLRGRGYPIFGADDHFEHRYRCGRCRHSDGAVSPLCGDAPVDL